MEWYNPWWVGARARKSGNNNIGASIEWSAEQRWHGRSGRAKHSARPAALHRTEPVTRPRERLKRRLYVDEARDGTPSKRTGCPGEK